MKRKYTYLILSIIGICATWFYNIQFFQTAADTTMSNFIAETMTTFPAKSIVADISVVAFTFFVWMISESLRLKIQFWWILIPLTFMIAIAFTFPFFMFMRENRLEKIQSGVA